MSASTHQMETRLATLLDERSVITEKWEDLTAAVNSREGAALDEHENDQIVKYRGRVEEIDAETTSLASDIEKTRESIKNAKILRQKIVGMEDSVEEDGDGIVYRTFSAYARDMILTRGSEECAKIATQTGSDEVLKARERLNLLKRTPANTLSSNVAGLTPPQYIDQIFQVINDSRPLVESATKVALERGTLTYPKISQRPIVSVQSAEKTEAGNQAMHVDMVTTTASVYLGGGDLSWQAINWSTPSALDLWFQLAAADYALKTEQDAATILRDSAFSHVIGTTIGSTPTFADFMTAVGAGAAAVFANSQRTADTVYMAVDRYWYVFGTTSTAFAQFTNVGGDNVGPLRFVPSRGLDSGLIIVGDSDALLCAETPGAPVELRVVEPAIGGLEVGIIGGFEAQVADDGAFAQVTTAS